MTGTTADRWTPIGESLSASGEAPFWHPREERLYWIDPPLKRLWRHHMPSGRTEHWDLPRRVTGLVPCRSGGLLLVMDDGVYHTGAWQDVPSQIAVLPQSAEPQVLRGGRCDPWGRLWVASTPASAYDHPDPGAAGSLYCLHARNRPNPPLFLVRGAVVDSHGWSWSPDGRFIHWCASHRGEVEQAGLSMPGSWPPALGMPMTFARFASEMGRPRSGTMDRLGRYWVTLTETGRVACLDARGQLVADIPVPARTPMGICLGGSDLRTLFITTARAGQGPADLKTHPDSGRVFAMTVDTPGAPTAVYWD